jgi:hypothetical protein
MPTIACRLALMLLLVLPAACVTSDSSGGGQGVVTDTLGNKFNVDCSSGLCVCTPLDGSLTANSCVGGSGSDAFVLAPFSVLSIYALFVSSYGGVQLSAANPSHPAACTGDADCLPGGVPTSRGTATYGCRNGLCQCTTTVCTNTDGNPSTYDVLTLCQADIPWPKACPYVTSPRYASRIAEVAAVCGSQDTCGTVPADCRQLTAVAPAIDGGAPPASGVDGGP